MAFAARSLSRQPGRAAVGLLGIAAVGALLLDMLLLSQGLVVSFRNLLDGVGFDVRVMATDAMPMSGVRIADATRVAADLRRLPEVNTAVPFRAMDAELVNGSSTTSFDLTAIDLDRRRPWTMIRGNDLASSAAGVVSPSLVVNRRFVETRGLAIGSIVPIRIGCGANAAALPPIEMRIAGVAEFPFDAGAKLSAVASRAAVQAICRGGNPANEDQADMILVASREGFGADAAVSAIKRARPDLRPVTNEEIVRRMQTQGFSYFRQISAVLSTITLLFGFLLITVLLTVSVNQRLAQIAALRALGFSRVRVAGDVLCQSILLVGSGGVLALPLGLALSVWLDAILKKMPGIPETLHFFVFDARALALQAVILAAAALLAAMYPMFLVTRLPIAATLRREVV